MALACRSIKNNTILFREDEMYAMHKVIIHIYK